MQEKNFLELSESLRNQRFFQTLGIMAVFTGRYQHCLPNCRRYLQSIKWSEAGKRLLLNSIYIWFSTKCSNGHIEMSLENFRPAGQLCLRPTMRPYIADINQAESIWVRKVWSMSLALVTKDLQFVDAVEVARRLRWSFWTGIQQRLRDGHKGQWLLSYVVGLHAEMGRHDALSAHLPYQPASEKPRAAPSSQKVYHKCRVWKEWVHPLWKQLWSVLFEKYWNIAVDWQFWLTHQKPDQEQHPLLTFLFQRLGASVKWDLERASSVWGVHSTLLPDVYIWEGTGSYWFFIVHLTAFPMFMRLYDQEQEKESRYWQQDSRKAWEACFSLVCTLGRAGECSRYNGNPLLAEKIRRSTFLKTSRNRK